LRRGEKPADRVIEGRAMPDACPPVLARVCRGGRTESAHRGAVVVADSDGRVVASAGNPDAPVFLRSVAKPFQAIPLVDAGGERAFRLTDDEIALMCASHGGEPRHVRVARRILRKGGLDASDLICGPQEPMDPRAARALAAKGEEPTALHNNCSGNHGGLLLACRLLGLPVEGYARPEHPLQQRILSIVATHTAVRTGEIGIAVDGCGLPVFHLPLSGVARAYAFFAAARSGSARGRDARAVRRIGRAMCASPAMVAGRGRFTTALLEAGRGSWIGKEGAEGIYAMALSRSGEAGPLGVAFKIEDGSTRARDAVALEILSAIGRLGAAAASRLSVFRRPLVRNAGGAVVGEIVGDVPLAFASEDPPPGSLSADRR
jgi:L-asparaginase II